MLGFTKNEQRILCFLSISFIAGLGIKMYREYLEPLPELSDNSSLENYINQHTETGGIVNHDSVLNLQKVILLHEKKIDINNASAEELTYLPGIGPVMAERIIAYRVQQGLFKHPDMILNVKGIGPKTLEKIREYIIIDSIKEEK